MTGPYPFSTSWTGNGDGTSWSDPANWSNGLPPPAAAAATATDDVATIDNSVITTPYSVVIAGTQSVAQLNIAAQDPAGGVAVSLTGELDMSTNVTSSGSGFGAVVLTTGTLEIDGGTLSGADVQLKGGTLAFGAGTDTLNGVIVDGALAFNNGRTVVINSFGVFDGAGGYGTATTDVVTDGAMVSVAGGLYLDGEIDVQNGTLSLGGGGLNGWGGTARLYQDGGTINLTANETVTSAWTIEGGLTFTGADTLTVSSGGSLTLGDAALPAPTVVNLDGGTIDVSGILALKNTVLENGTVILEAGSTYTADTGSSLSGVTLTDNRPVGQTNWTGAAGDGDWSNAANWTNGVPQSGLGFASDGQSVAVVNDALSSAPVTITIAGAVNAQDITIAVADPATGPSVLLTGSLDTSWSGEGGAYGSLTLNSGTFELDNGAISYTGIAFNGGTLSFGAFADGQNTFNTDIFNGNWSADNALLVFTGYDILHGQGGGPNTTVTLTGGTQLLQDNGTFALDGVLDIQTGANASVFALNGGNLSGYGGDAATIFIDGGQFAVDANTTFSNAINIYGGDMVFGNGTNATVTIDNSSVTSIGQAGANQTYVNLNGGTLDVQGTLNLTNTYIENGTIIVEAGATFNQDATDTLNNVSVSNAATTATNWTGAGDGTSWTDPANWDNGVPVAGDPYTRVFADVATIDNTRGDAGPFTVDITGTQYGAELVVNAQDPSGGAAVSLQGTLDLAYNVNNGSSTLGYIDLQAGTLEVDGGTLSILNVNQDGGQITFGSAAQWGASTLDAAGIAGDFTIGNGSDLVIAQYSFGAFNQANGGTVGNVTIADNSTLDIKGSLGSGNNIDVVSGTVNLDGGSLNMGNGAKLVQEGGGFVITGNGTLDDATIVGGGITIGGGNTLTIAAGHTAQISNPGGQYTIELGGGTIDVQGTLDVQQSSGVAGSIIDTGSLILENGSTLENAVVNSAYQFDDPTISVNGNATLDNVSIDAPITFGGAVVLTLNGVTNFGNAADPSPMTVDLGGGVLDVFGTLNLTNTDITNGTIVLENGGTLTSDALSQLNGVTVEQTLANGDVTISGDNVIINSNQILAAGQTVSITTGVNAGGTANGTPGTVTFGYNNGPSGFAGAGTIAVTDANGLSSTNFGNAVLNADVAGQTLEFATDTWSSGYGTFEASNGGTLVVGDAAHAVSNLTNGVFGGTLSATGGSNITLYAATGIATVNGQITLDGTSQIAVDTPTGTAALAQSLTSIGSQNPTTYVDQMGILNLNNGASFIDPNAVTLYGTINLTGGTLSTGGLSGNEVFFGGIFGSVYSSGVKGYGTLDGPFGSATGVIYMQASGGTLTFNGTLTNYSNLMADVNSTLIVNSGVGTPGYSGGNYIAIAAGGTVVLNGPIIDAAAITVNFAGSNATLTLNDPHDVNLQNLYVGGSGAFTGDAIDLAGLVPVTKSDGTSDFTITLIDPNDAKVVINPADDPGHLDSFTISGLADKGLSFVSDGHGGSEILIGTGANADLPSIAAPDTEAVTQNSITALGGFSISQAGAQSSESFSVTISDTSGLLSVSSGYAIGQGTNSITLNGPLYQVNAELAALTLDEQVAGTDTLNIKVTDNYGGTTSKSVAVTSTHVASPDLTVSAITPAPAAIEGQTVQLTWTVTNSGDATATGPWTDNVYLATDSFGNNKTLVGSFTYNGTLAPGQSETETQTISVPSGFYLDSQTGTATTYFVVQADANSQTGALSGFQNHQSVATTTTAVTASVNWPAVFAAYKPLVIDATDNALIEQRWVAEVGTTNASLQTAIHAAIAALNTTGSAPATATQAITLLAIEAMGGLADQQLAQVSPPSISSGGLNFLLTPSYNSDLVSRNNSGVFGDGWTSELNDLGPLGAMNGFGPGHQIPGAQSYVLETITTYVDQYGHFLGKSITYSVVAPPGTGIDFLDPTTPYSNYTKTNANGTVETFDGKSGLLIGISDGQGDAITINRNAAGVITSIATASGTPPTFTVNALGNITSATDSSGHTITYTYDASGTHLLSTTTASGTTSYQYANSSNQFIQNALTQVTNPDGSSLAYTYTAQGDIASKSANGGPATTFGYTSPNTVTRTDGNGQRVTYTYDGNGQLSSATDAGGNTFTIQRDTNGHVTALTTAAGDTYHYAYNSGGNLATYTDPLGKTVQFAYSPGTSDVTAIADQNGNTTQYAYNAAGQVSGITEANGAAAQYTYDANGKVSQITEASGATIQYTYNALGETTRQQFSDGTSQSYTYDANGHLTSSIAVDGGLTTYTYTAQGLLASVTDPAGQVESYSYNAQGQEAQRVEPDGTITNYTYNSAGLLAQVSDGNGNVIAKYSYDGGGRLTEKDTGNGAKTLYTYNAAGAITEIKTLASDSTTTSKIDYTYDADSRIATATSGDGTWTYGYDANNQLTHAVFASTNAAIANQDLTYVYDAAGNRTQTIFNAATTNYATNNLNQYTSANGTTYSYDANGNLVQLVSGANTTTYTYNIQNQLVSSTGPSGTTAYTYDALGDIASQTVNGVKTSYVSDPLAFSTSANGPLSAVAQAYNASGQATATYTYGDGLTAVTSSGTTSYYNADASGNITSLSGAGGALTATYAYTPTGTLLNSTGSAANPFQFNGQVGAITQSNGLVKIGARYYDPSTARFTSQDPTGQAGGINLYSFAANNPINYSDVTGDSISPVGVAASLLGIGFTIAALPAELTVATAGVVVLAAVGTVSSVYSFWQALHQDNDVSFTLHKDTPGDIASAVISTTFSVLGGLPSEAAAVKAGVVGLINSGASLTDLYNQFLEYITTGTVTINVPQGGGRGDVHLTTFDGLHYDFQAVGEFVLAKSTVAGDNFQVQIRLSPYGAGPDFATITTELAVQVGNDRVTFDGNRAATVWVDGVASGISTAANTLTLSGGTITELSQNEYQITENTGEVVDITTGSYEGYTIDLAPSAKPGSVQGLLGSFSGSANDFQLPDGTVLGSSLTSVQLYQTFGNAWRITDATSLLDYAPGQNTATFTDLSHPSYGLPVSSLPTTVVAAATAAVAAAGITDPTAAADAVYDYLVTGNPSFITSTATSGSTAPVTANAVITQSAPPPPSIGISPSAPTLTEISGQTPVTFTISLTSAAAADTVVNYAVSAAAIDQGKTYFNAGDFGGTLPSGTVTIHAGQTQAQITVDVPDSALGTSPDKWLAVNISTPGADPIYASTAQVDIFNNGPVAGAAAQPVLEYVPGNALSATQNAPALSQTGNSYTLNLGNVVQGSSLAALQFALANLASAPADSLNASLASLSGSGFNETGLQTAAVITAGGAYSGVYLQASTTSLGTQSETVTFGVNDVNKTGYSGSLPNITLAVTENVIAAAQASVSSSAITLADVRVGASDSQTITVTNTAATGAASLDVTLGASTGATASGSISQLAAGASDSTSLTLGLATTLAGLQSSFVTLNLASDLGSGVSVPLPLNQSVALTGAVFRQAAATITQSSAVVHVGDPASQTLSILNSDPADGYSESLRATVTGATGSIGASGTTGLVAAGTSDTSSVSVSYSTAAAGVISGQINLGLTSDGTGVDSLAPISIGSQAVSFSVQVDNYAQAVVTKASGTGVLTGSATTGYTLNLGNVAQGAASLTTALGINNVASGLADLLGGGFVVTGASSAFTNTLDIASGLGAGQTDTGSSVSLSTASAGTFTETLTLNATGSNASGYSGALTPITLTVTGTVIGSAVPVLNSASTVNFGDVHVGQVATTTLSLSNAGAAGSASLDVTPGVVNGAVGVSGAISQLAAGATDASSITASLSTATAGAVSGTIQLNEASDTGTGPTHAVGSPQVTLSGTVYREAAATLTAPATVIVHTGDAGGSLNEAIAVANGDASDGYSEGLIASVTGFTGAITSASGTTGDIAAGASDGSTIKLAVSTQTSGVKTGTVTLGLTSDGTGVDSLGQTALAAQVANVTVQVDNFATADLHETSGGGTLTGSAGAGYTLDLGTIAQGSGPATIGLAALNSASGLADLLAGTFAVSGDSAFANSGFTGFSGLSAGQSDNALQVSLSTLNDGTFSETITLDGTGSNASGYSGTVAPVTLTITGQVASFTPVISGGSFGGAISELPGTTGSSSSDTAQGAIDFTDANLTASHAASVLSVSASGDTAGLPANATLLSLFSLGPIAEDTASVPGSVAWNFAAPDSTFDYLAAGDTLTLTYAVQVAEVGGGSVTRNVTVTVTGSNDVPQIAAGTSALATLTEIVAGGHRPANDTASGVIRFTDPDQGDTHTASVASVVASGALSGLASNATLLGLLSTGAPTEPSGTTAGSVGWNFAAPDATFAYLLPGQTVTLTYTVDVSDNHGGTVAQEVTVTLTGAPGTVVHSASAGTYLGIAFASSNTSYTAAGKVYLRTYLDAAGNELVRVSFAADGGYTATVGGVVTQVKAVNADGSYHVTNYSGGTFTGYGAAVPFAYASLSASYTSAGLRTLETFADGSGNVLASISFAANGGYTSSFGGVVTQVKAVNPDGSYSLTNYSGGTFIGYGVPASFAYASVVNSYNAAGQRTFETFDDGSGNVLASFAFTSGGGYTLSFGGVVSQVKAVNADGSYHVTNYSGGTFTGYGTSAPFAYASWDASYTATGQRMLQTFADASGNVLASIAFVANGGFTATVGGVVTAVKTVNADGSSLVETENLVGKDYTAQFAAYNAAGTLIAASRTLTDGSNVTTLHGAGLMFADVAGSQTVGNGADTFELGADTHGTLNVGGAANATVAFGTGDGAQIVNGFATSGAGADILSFSSSVFADWAHLLGATRQVGHDLQITLDASDTVLLKNVSLAKFTASDARFV